jgi:hypothetical protein
MTTQSYMQTEWLQHHIDAATAQPLRCSTVRVIRNVATPVHTTSSSAMPTSAASHQTAACKHKAHGQAADESLVSAFMDQSRKSVCSHMQTLSAAERACIWARRIALQAREAPTWFAACRQHDYAAAASCS